MAWQREGFEMFGKLMDSIDDDYLRYVMHVQVIAAPAEDPDYAQAAFEAADDPAAGLGELPSCRRAELRRRLDSAAAGRGRRTQASVPSARPRHGRRRRCARGLGPSGRAASRGTPTEAAMAAAPQARASAAGPISPTGTRIVGGPPAKVGRNEPCWCGSGRKFKVCHGAS